MGATVLDKNGRAVPFVMGCYGIGIGRTAASAIEQNNDEKGIIWPKAIAPFEVVVIPMNTNEDDVVRTADDIYNELLVKGADAIIDDRNERAGVKLTDSELIGYPLRISVGKKGLSEGKVDITIRKTGETVSVPAERAAEEAVKLLAGIN